RPYESLFFCLPVAIALFVWLFSSKARPLRMTGPRIVLPIFFCVLLTLTAIGYYFFRVTGSPLRNPYMVNQAAYMPMSYFPWTPLKAIPEYHHEIMRRFYLGYFLDLYNLNRYHPIVGAFIKLSMIGFFYLGALFALPLFI